MAQLESEPTEQLRLGVIADTRDRAQRLGRMVTECGYQAGSLLVSSECQDQDLLALDTQLDAWLLDVDFEEGHTESLDRWLAQSQLPVMVGEGCPAQPGTEEYQAWLKRTGTKLRQLIGQLNLAQQPVAGDREIWVLCASTGGPPAVKAFIDALPPGLGVAFIYVQHIDAGFEQNLVNMLGDESAYPAYTLAHGDVLRTDAIAVVRNDETIELLENGTLLVSPGDWPGPYSPSADQVIANVARYFPERSGAIIFSGMGDDGMRGCRLLKQRGGMVWVQAPSSCTIAAMPEAVLTTGCVDTIGPPQKLAQALSQRLSPALAG